MKELITVDELTQAKHWVDQWLPSSCALSMWLKINLDKPGGCGTSRNWICYVDSWPNPRIIVGVDLHPIFGVEKYPKFSLFSPPQHPIDEIEKFLMILNEKLNISQIGGLEVKAIDMRLWPICDKVYVENMELKSDVSSWRCTSYWLPEKERHRLQRRSIDPPVGFKLDILTQVDAEFVDLNWPHRADGITLDIIKRQIADFPQICLREIGGSERLACWELVEAEVGCMSHLYTVEQFRRKGLATAVEEKLAQLIIDKDWIPVKHVLVDNKSALGLVKARPMWEHTGDVVWLRYGDEKMAAEY